MSVSRMQTPHTRAHARARVEWGAMAIRRPSRAIRVCSAGYANYGGVPEVDPNEPTIATHKLVVQSNTYEKNFVRPVS